MLVGSGRALVKSTTSVSPTSASMVGPGTCPLNPYPGTTWPGAISHLVSAASSRTVTVFPVPAAFEPIDPSFRPLAGSTDDEDLTKLQAAPTGRFRHPRPWSLARPQRL